jgi:hypothetical protein
MPCARVMLAGIPVLFISLTARSPYFLKYSSAVAGMAPVFTDDVLAFLEDPQETSNRIESMTEIYFNVNLISTVLTKIDIM